MASALLLLHRQLLDEGYDHRGAVLALSRRMGIDRASVARVLGRAERDERTFAGKAQS
jgi:hypothetical protein